MSKKKRSKILEKIIRKFDRMDALKRKNRKFIETNFDESTLFYSSDRFITTEDKAYMQELLRKES